MDSSPTPAATRGRVAIAAGLLALVLCALLAPALENGFVWLDHLEIVSGELIVERLADVPGLFLDDRNFGGYHRPVYDLLHSLDVALFGLEPRGHHATSLGLHVLNAALFLVLLARCRVPLPLAFAASLAWAVHPLNAPTFGLLHAKADLAVASALLGTVLLADSAAREGGRARWVAAGACFALALFTKETAFVLPLGLAWFAWRESRLRAFWGATVMLAVGAGALRLAGSGAVVHEASLPLAERLATFATVYVDAVRDALLPTELRLADTVTAWSARPLGAQVRYALALAVLVALQVAGWRRRPELRAWILAGNLALLPVAQLVPILHFRAERFLYLPGLALVGALAEGGARALRSRRDVLLLAGALLAATLPLALATRARLATFEDDATLFAPEVVRTPDYLEGLAALAVHHDRAGRPQIAASYYAQVLEPHPGRVSYLERGSFAVNASSNLLRLGRADLALELLDALSGEATEPRHVEELRYNRAVALLRLGREGEALPLFVAYAAAHPTDAGARVLLGRCADALGETALAREAYGAYLELAPEAADAGEVRERLEALRAGD